MAVLIAGFDSYDNYPDTGGDNMLPFRPLGSRVIPFRDVAVLNEDILLPIKRKPKEFQEFSNNVFPELSF